MCVCVCVCVSRVCGYISASTSERERERMCVCVYVCVWVCIYPGWDIWTSIFSHTFESILTCLTHMNESCFTYEGVMSHTSQVSRRNQSCLTHMNESCHMHKWVMSQMCHVEISQVSNIWMSHVSHICMSQVSCTNESCFTHINESCPPYEWVNSHVQSVASQAVTVYTQQSLRNVTVVCHVSHIWVSHVSHTNESCLTCKVVPPRHSQSTHNNRCATSR